MTDESLDINEIIRNLSIIRNFFKYLEKDASVKTRMRIRDALAGTDYLDLFERASIYAKTANNARKIIGKQENEKMLSENSPREIRKEVTPIVVDKTNYGDGISAKLEELSDDSYQYYTEILSQQGASQQKINNLIEVCRHLQEQLDIASKQLETVLSIPEKLNSLTTLCKNQHEEIRTIISDNTKKTIHNVVSREETTSNKKVDNVISEQLCLQRDKRIPSTPAIQNSLNSVGNGMKHKLDTLKPQAEFKQKNKDLNDEEAALVQNYNQNKYYRTNIKFGLDAQTATDRTNDLQGFTTMEVAQKIPFLKTTGQGLYFGEEIKNKSNSYYILPLKNWKLSETWIKNNAVEDVFAFEAAALAQIDTLRYELVYPAIFTKLPDKEEYHLVRRGLIKPL